MRVIGIGERWEVEGSDMIDFGEIKRLASEVLAIRPCLRSLVDFGELLMFSYQKSERSRLQWSYLDVG